MPACCVLDITCEKHPEPLVIDESAFLPCDDLPRLLDLYITVDYVECIYGSPNSWIYRTCGSTALQWHRYLLQYGVFSACLLVAVTMFAHHLANGIVNWKGVRALIAS